MYHSRILGGAGSVVRQWQRREQISDATLQRQGAWQHFNVLRFELGFVRLQCKAKHYDEITIQGARTGKLYLRYESLSDVGESRVWFASKNLTPCRMH